MPKNKNKPAVLYLWIDCSLIDDDTDDTLDDFLDDFYEEETEEGSLHYSIGKSLKSRRSKGFATICRVLGAFT